MKLTKTCKENQERTALWIRRYDVTHAGFKTLQLHNLVRTDQNTRELCTKLFFP